jgi:hypothetical protein
MNTLSHASLAVFALVLVGCSRPTPPPPPPTAPAVAAPAPPPPPAKKAVMVCRNSQTGAKARCGTPNAIMVGVKTE